jgi:hypothetical protein
MPGIMGSPELMACTVGFAEIKYKKIPRPTLKNGKCQIPRRFARSIKPSLS